MQGKVIILTGADGGIGHAIAALLAENGADLLLCGYTGRRTSVGRSAEENFIWQNLRTVSDLTIADAARAVADACTEWFGKADVLINNAVEQAFHTLLTLSPEI